MEKSTTKTATPDEIWAILRETAASQKETERKLQNAARIVEENVRSQKETERIMKERSAEIDRKFKELHQEISGIGKSNGEFAEEYFENVFAQNKTFANMHFDEMLVNKHFNDRKREDEYDIILINNKNVAIVETKYNARATDIEKVIKKAESFRYWFPEHKKHKIYLGLASLHFTKDILDKAKENGIAIIRQKGDKTIVNDKNLKAY